MDMFHNAFGSGRAPNGPAATPANQPTPQGNIPADAAAKLAGNGVTPQNQDVPQTNNGSAEAQSASPLDAFKDLWQPAATPKDAQGNPVPASKGMFNLDPAKIMETAGKINFKQSVSKDQLAAITAGGPDAMNALLDVINKVGQDAYAHSVQTNAQLMEAGFGKARTDFTAELPNHIKNYGVSRELSRENPAFAHPAAQPIIDAVKTQMMQKFPGASESEVAQKAREFVEGFANAAIPPKTDASSQQNKSSNTDWDAWVQS